MDHAPVCVMSVQQASLVVNTSADSDRTASHSALVMAVRQVEVIQSTYLGG